MPKLVWHLPQRVEASCQPIDPLIGGEADPAFGVMEAPQKRFEHRQRFGCDLAVCLALLRPASQAARPMHDPNLDVAIEGYRAAHAEHLLARLDRPNASRTGKSWLERLG
jgi:hypothetical protein